MTTLLNRYQQAILAELHIPIYQDKSRSESISAQTDAIISNSSQVNQQSDSVVTSSNSNHNDGDYDIELPQDSNKSPQSHPVVEQSVPLDKHKDAHLQSNVNSVESGSSKIAASTDLSRPASSEEYVDKVTQDKTIQSKTQAIKQLAAVIPASLNTHVNKAREPNQSSESLPPNLPPKINSQLTTSAEITTDVANIHLNGLSLSDLAVLQAWSENNQWLFECTPEQNIIAKHPKLTQGYHFDLNRSDNKKECWQLILNLTR